MPRAAAAKTRAKAAASDNQPAPTPSSPFESSITALLDGSQHSYAAHPRCTAKAQKLFAVDPVAFVSSLLSHLPRLLTIWHKSAPTERVLAFISSLCRSISPDEAHRAFFLSSLTDFLLRLLTSPDKAVRYRSTQLLARLLAHSEDGLTQSLFDRLRDALTQRLRDKQPLVRAAACQGLSFLQDEDEEPEAVDSDDDSTPPQREYRVTYALLRLAELDSSPVVRREALTGAAAQLHTRELVDLFISRLCDPSPIVRRALFHLLAQDALIPYRVLSLEHRAEVIRVGTADPDEGVKRGLVQLLQQWVKAHEGSLVDLITNLCYHFQPEVESLLRFVFRRGLQGDMGPQPPYRAEQLTFASALYWAVLCECEQGREEVMDALLPDTTGLCEALSMHAENTDVMRQLIRLCPHVRRWDVAGRRRLIGMMEDMLGDPTAMDWIDERMTDATVRCMRQLGEYADEGAFIQQVARIAARLRARRGVDGVEFEVLSPEHFQQLQQIGAAHVELTAGVAEARDELDAMDAEGDYSRAEEVRAAIQEMEEQLAGVEEREAETKELVPLISRLLLLVSATVANLAIGGGAHLHPFLQQVMVVMEQVTTLEHTTLRVQAVQALARYNLLDEGVAMQAFEHFVSLIPDTEGDGEGVEGEIQLVAIHAVVDAALTYPAILLADPPAFDSTLLAFRLFPYFDLDSAEVPGADSSHCVAAVEGLCKLLLHDRLPSCSPEALERLTSFYYHWKPEKAGGEDSGVLVTARAGFDQFRLRYVATDQGEGSAAPHVHMLLVGLLMTMRRAAYSDAKHFPAVQLIGSTCVTALVQAVSGDERKGRDVQGQLVEEVLAYAHAFPQSKLMRALLGMLDGRNVRPRVGEVEWMREGLMELKEQVGDRVAGKAIDRVVEAWGEEEGAGVGDVEALEGRRAQRVAMWRAYDETADGTERDHAERAADKGTRPSRRQWEEEDEVEEEEEVEAKVQSVMSVQRPMRQSRAVAEQRMAKGEKTRREQETAMKQREREEQASSAEEESSAEESSDSDAGASNKENMRGGHRARGGHSRQPTLKDREVRECMSRP